MLLRGIVRFEHAHLSLAQNVLARGEARIDDRTRHPQSRFATRRSRFRRDYAKPADRARNEREVLAYSRSLAERVISATQSGRFAVVLGGDCSIVRHPMCAVSGFIWMWRHQPGGHASGRFAGTGRADTG